MSRRQEKVEETTKRKAKVVDKTSQIQGVFVEEYTVLSMTQQNRSWIQCEGDCLQCENYSFVPKQIRQMNTFL